MKKDGVLKENGIHKIDREQELQQLKIQGKLIVSCQALPDEPLHSSFIMSRMALAAWQGGAAAIRANSVADIQEIKKAVSIPIIGIIKQDYIDSEIYITPTLQEVEALVQCEVSIIATDATNRIRPNGITLDEWYREVRKQYPNQLLMADCSTMEELLYADELGFDLLATTLVGYTKESQQISYTEEDFMWLKNALKHLKHPLIAEGNIDTPKKAARVLELGCYGVVVGTAITRPQCITKRFSQAVNQVQHEQKDSIMNREEDVFNGIL